LVGNYPADRNDKEKLMEKAVINFWKPCDAAGYSATLAAFLRTSARYLEVDAQVAGAGFSREAHERALRSAGPC
jgi:hypothetical protein